MNTEKTVSLIDQDSFKRKEELLVTVPHSEEEKKAESDLKIVELLRAKYEAERQIERSKEKVKSVEGEIKDISKSIEANGTREWTDCDTIIYPKLMKKEIFVCGNLIRTDELNARELQREIDDWEEENGPQNDSEEEEEEEQEEENGE